MAQKKNNPSKVTIKSNKNILKFIFLAFVVWQALIILITLFSVKVLSFQERFSYNDGLTLVNPKFLWNRANFDGAHYLSIAKHGYGLYEQTFFPFYPELIKLITPIFGGMDLVAGLLISLVSSIFFLFVFYKLVIFDYDDLTAKQAILFFLVFPTSFFLAMAYTESLFLMFLILSFYFARKKKWLWAGIFGGFASYTRVIGVFIFPALIYEWYQQNESSNIKTKLYSLLPVFLVPLGILKYMNFLAIKYNDALLFFHVQSNFGAGRSDGRIILIYQVFWRYLKMVADSKFYYSYFAVWLEFLTAFFFAVLLILAYVKKVRFSYIIFSTFSYFIPTLSGTFLSLPRFALTFFPCFIIFGKIRNSLLKWVLFILFGIFFTVSTMFFLRGYWVA